MGYSNSVQEWEGDQTQSVPSNYTWKSKKFELPFRHRLGAARVLFESTDKAAYLALVEAYRSALYINQQIISSGSLEGDVGSNDIGSIDVADDALVTVPATPSYTGDDTLTFNLYGDGSLVFTKEVYDTKPFRVASPSSRYRSFEVEVVGNVIIHRVDVAGSIAELQASESA